MKALTIYKQVDINEKRIFKTIGYRIGQTVHRDKQTLIDLGFDFIERDVLEETYELDENGERYSIYKPEKVDGIYVPDLKAIEANKIKSETLSQIAELEAQQTPRLLRELSLGGEFAINKLNEIEAEIQELRSKL